MPGIHQDAADIDLFAGAGGVASAANRDFDVGWRDAETPCEARLGAIFLDRGQLQILPPHGVPVVSAPLLSRSFARASIHAVTSLFTQADECVDSFTGAGKLRFLMWA